MSPPLFLVPALPSATEYTLDGPEGRHAATVMRLGAGERLLLGDGRGSTVEATVTAVGKGTLTLALGRPTFTPAPAPRLVVVQAIAKGERGELAVQAMTEVGVDAVVPWAAARSVALWKAERVDRSHRRWADTAREAAKQSRRPWLPAVLAPAATAAVESMLRGAVAALVLHESADARLSTVDLPEPGDPGDVVLVVGPEGGLTEEELARFGAAGASAVRLGPSVLRTSTAGVAALSVLSARLGRW